jgi:hypothetical protein
MVLLLAAVAHAQLFDYDKSAALNFTQKELDKRDGSGFPLARSTARAVRRLVF